MVPSSYVSLVYDAVMTMGISACQQKQRFFTSDQLLETIRHQSFDGASGYVTFNNVTGTRDSVGLRYTITNVLLNRTNNADNDIGGVGDGRIRFNAKKRIAIEFSPDHAIDNFDNNGPYIFADDTINIPPALPPVDVDMNLIHDGVRYFGWILMGAIILSSLCCCCFAYIFRDATPVKIAQPAFLMLISTGCFIMSLSIVPLSFQEPLSPTLLDVGCMAQLYLFSFGFVLSFSALYCKLNRVNTLLKSARQFRRLKVDVRDVMSPLIKLLTVNSIVLLSWTFIDPLRWTRHDIPNSLDVSGRITATYATCSGKRVLIEKIFYILFFAVNFVALVIANHESYKGRNLPTAYNEARGIVTCMFFLLETLVIGLPVLFSVKDDPTGGFIVQTVLIGSVCLAILCPIFLPLWRKRGSQRAISKRRDVRIGADRRSVLYLSQPTENDTIVEKLKRSQAEVLAQSYGDGLDYAMATGFAESYANGLDYSKAKANKNGALAKPYDDGLVMSLAEELTQSNAEEPMKKRVTRVCFKDEESPQTTAANNDDEHEQEPQPPTRITSLRREEGADSFVSYAQEEDQRPSLPAHIQSPVGGDPDGEEETQPPRHKVSFEIDLPVAK